MVLRVFTDASVGLDGRCGIGVVWPTATRSVWLHGRCRDPNLVELLAVLVAITDAPPSVDLVVCTDSSVALHVLRAIASGTRRPRHSVHGRAHDDVAGEILRATLARRGRTFFEKVRAHSGVLGNELADRAARRAVWACRTRCLAARKLLERAGASFRPRCLGSGVPECAEVEAEFGRAVAL
jgi:ribonuclease HI